MWRVLSLALVVSTASAEPAKRACSAGGGVLFEVDQRATGKRTTATTVLYGNGAWRSNTFDTDGKPSSPSATAVATHSTQGVQKRST